MPSRATDRLADEAAGRVTYEVSLDVRRQVSQASSPLPQEPEGPPACRAPAPWGTPLTDSVEYAVRQQRERDEVAVHVERMRGVVGERVTRQVVAGVVLRACRPAPDGLPVLEAECGH